MRQRIGIPLVHSTASTPGRETSLDRPILLAALAVLLAIVAARQTNLGSVSIGILVLAVIYNIVVIVIRWASVVSSAPTQYSIIASIALESFLIGLFALTVIDAREIILSLTTCLLIVIAFVFFFSASRQADIEMASKTDNAIVSILPSDKADPSRRSSKVGSIPMPILQSIKEQSANPPLVIETPPRERSEQSQTPLFENDPLYIFPAFPHHTRFFVVPKNNDARVKCEDACAISDNRRFYALSDGVSSSNFPRPWASLLAQSWVENPNEFVQCLKTEQLEHWIGKRRARWEEWIYKVWLPSINKRNLAQGKPPITSAVADEVIQGGAAATFLGLRLSSKAWECFAVGDTCLFLLREDQHGFTCKKAFPLEHASDFNSSPATLSTFPNASFRVHVQHFSGPLQQGDLFLLATDALAAWILQCVEQGDLAVWQRLLTIQNDQQFEMFVNQMRNERSQFHMNDDDTSLIVIEAEKLMRK